MQASWDIFKAFVDSKSLSIQWIDFGDGYYLRAFDNCFNLLCILPKDGGADVVDFETHYKAAGNKPLKQEVITQTEKDNKTKKYLAFHAMASAGGEAPVSTAFMVRVPGTLRPIMSDAGIVGFVEDDENDRLVYGGEFWSESQDSRDYIQIDVVDHENVLGQGVDFVLKTYYEDVSQFQVYPTEGENAVNKKPGIQISPGQKTIIYSDSPARLHAGMWLRLIYWNYSGVAVKVHANINWDKKD